MIRPQSPSSVTVPKPIIFILSPARIITPNPSFPQYNPLGPFYSSCYRSRIQCPNSIYIPQNVCDRPWCPLPRIPQHQLIPPIPLSSLPILYNYLFPLRSERKILSLLASPFHWSWGLFLYALSDRSYPPGGCRRGVLSVAAHWSRTSSSGDTLCGQCHPSLQGRNTPLCLSKLCGVYPSLPSPDSDSSS